MPWTCKGCDEAIEDSFEECWNCGTNRDGSPPDNEELFISTDLSRSERDSLDLPAISGSEVETQATRADATGRTATANNLPKSAVQRRVSARAATRYDDAYSVAGAIIGWAALIKVFGAAAAVAVFVASIASGDAVGLDAGGAAVIIGFLCGSLMWAVFYGIGVVVAAQGQILRASLDSAVHSSPFLTDQQRAEAMSL
jgi:hypothetical protein